MTMEKRDYKKMLEEAQAIGSGCSQNYIDHLQAILQGHVKPFTGLGVFQDFNFRLWENEQKAAVQKDVIDFAIDRYHESPEVCKLAANFAAEQGENLKGYSARERIFFLTDGEPYTASYIINHYSSTEFKEGTQV